MKYQWKYDVYHDETGKIVGRIVKSNFLDGYYWAEADNRQLGEYISDKHAKAAVEKAIDLKPESDYTNGYSGSSNVTATWNESQLGENH